MDEGACGRSGECASGGKALCAPGHEVKEVDEEIGTEHSSEEAVLAARPAVRHLVTAGLGARSAHWAVMTRGRPPITVPARGSYRTRGDEAIVAVSMPISRRTGASPQRA